MLAFHRRFQNGTKFPKVTRQEAETKVVDRCVGGRQGCGCEHHMVHTLNPSQSRWRGKAKLFSSNFIRESALRIPGGSLHGVCFGPAGAEPNHQSCFAIDFALLYAFEGESSMPKFHRKTNEI